MYVGDINKDVVTWACAWVHKTHLHVPMKILHLNKNTTGEKEQLTPLANATIDFFYPSIYA